MTMRKLSTCFSAITVMLIFLQNHLVASLSPIQQKVALFQFKQSLNITTPTDDCYYYDSYTGHAYYGIPSYPKTMNWSMSSDHCTWEGVSCEQDTGHVIGLDLSCSQLVGAILPNSTLFQLSHLQFLNLSQNDFSLSNQFPQEFGSFAKGLTHLNLSHTWFSGRVPSGISHLYKLVSLDLGYIFDAKLDDEVFKSVIQNLTQLRVLNLNWVNISPVLPVNLSTSLRVLNLRVTGIHGVLPQEVFHLPNIEVLYLGGSNYHDEETGLEAVLPKVKWGSSGTLQHLFLKKIDIYGGIPDSIGFLESLATLELLSCNLSGPIPRSIGNLGQLTSLRVLDLGYTGLHGVLPQEVFHLPNLEVLDLGSNKYDEGSSYLQAVLPKVKWGSSGTLQQLSLFEINFNGGGIPDSIGCLESLAVLGLQNCNLSGPIPRSIGNLGQLTDLGLGHNNLNGPIPTVLTNLTNLGYLYLNDNNFTGPFLSSVAHFKGLVVLDLGNNGFTGLLPPWLFNHPSLEVLSLSYNGFTGQLYESNSSKSQLKRFDCRSNLLYGRIPQSLFQLVNLTYLDMSNNEIEGEIPHGSMGWYYLSLSHNRLTGGIEQLPWNKIRYLDLQSNKLNGSLPTLICNSSFLLILNLIRYLDLQSNK